MPLHAKAIISNEKQANQNDVKPISTTAGGCNKSFFSLKSGFHFLSGLVYFLGLGNIGNNFQQTPSANILFVHYHFRALPKSFPWSIALLRSNLPVHIFHHSKGFECHFKITFNHQLAKEGEISTVIQSVLPAATN